jgi:hypothetical protein
LSSATSSPLALAEASNHAPYACKREIEVIGGKSSQVPCSLIPIATVGGPGPEPCSDKEECCPGAVFLAPFE